MNEFIYEFRELIAGLVQSKVEGFDKWQEVFSKVIDLRCLFLSFYS